MRLRVTALFVGLCLVAGTPAQDKAAVTYATPKAVFDAAIKAEKKSDYKTFMSLYDPKSRLLVTGQFVSMSAMFDIYIKSKEGAKYKDKAPALEKLLAKHGVGREAMAKAVPGGKLGSMPDEKTLRELGKTVKDPGAFVHEIMPFLEGLGLSKKGGGESAELKDLEIEGDKAKGVKVKQVDGKEVREPIEFVKVGRSWHLVAEKAKKGRKGDK